MTARVRSSVPLHHQIAQVLLLRLESGAWVDGGPLITEQRLCEEFGASRTTVRQALSQLKQVGLLESRAGVGTRSVVTPVKRKIIRSIGDPLHAGFNSKPRVVSLGPVPSPPAVSQFFGLPLAAPIWNFVRIHTLDDKPLSVVDSYLPLHLGAGLTRTALKQQMNELLWERFGIRLKRSVHTLRVARADVDIASMLGIALADPVLRIQASAFLSDGKPIRWTDNYFREDQYEYVAEMEWPAPAARSDTDGKQSRRSKE